MTPQSYLEKDFEEHIEEHLLSTGYLKRLSEEYDRSLCLITDEVLDFVKSTQPKEYEKLERQYGADTPAKLCRRLSDEITSRGTLAVLRKGFKDRGASFRMAYFKPSSGMNPEHRRLYEQNRFSIVRQLAYSKRNEKTIDVVIFLNGIPIITAELKNSLTAQFVENAIKQYKTDRDPKEPLLQFKRCLVHFAVGNEKVFMTTRLQGDGTRFLPFNKGTENPVNPNGHKTAYLWEDILQPDTLLELLKSYLHIQKITEKKFDKQKGLFEKEYETLIFPRYHQLDAVRTLLTAVRQQGVGHNYLIQHSAGSGKSNSIAWLAHKLASFYRKETDKERMFDSIIVVTDRKILDRQLQNTIKQFEQTTGVVNPIDINSAQLRDALGLGKDIIITTLQKFPVISESTDKLAGHKFAVILDEAHSSQSGESAKHLKKTLSVNLEQAEEEDRDDFDPEDEINNIIEEIRARGKQPHISFFAFTATPKNKTLELFGQKLEDGSFVATHIYSMRQAIEEVFILNILENYTTYKRYFKLVKTVETDKEYETKKAKRLLVSYVDLQPHTFETKTRIMLDHFLEKTERAIQGRGRAMVVTRSRLHAVKYFLMFKKVMEEMNLPYKPLVAFSGTVKDPDSPEEYTETSLNRLPPRVAIQDAYKTPEYRILIVAEKFQTGFDEPLLHTMYVDKKLSGLQAVQTLSRLNRTLRGKSETFILDFVNEAEEIRDAFQPYYQTTFLEEEIDPNKLHNLEDELEQFGIFTKEHIEEFAKIFFNPKEPPERMQPILDRVVEVWRERTEEEREDFRSILQRFVRLYGFISQIIIFQNIEWEKLYVFGKNLNRKLPKRKPIYPDEIRDAVDLDSFRIQKTFNGSPKPEEKDGVVTWSNGKVKHEKGEKDLLSLIIKTLNETYGVDLTDEDKVDLERIQEKLNGDEGLQAVLSGNNTKENKKYKFDKVFDDLLLEFVNTKIDLYKKMNDPKVNAMLKRKLFEGMIGEAARE
ncbi:MAG: type I restriction endonuclease subunit R [Deltaproteobacteria bacterium]|uniref:Type I restriction endonuclease subunit R n=1 Tax=Candidatus Zymogenus saltonus TaxID=2844893 RepID=A0A9D8KG89_9DELT|nr:type I restriction endonuclease subunit R [Candidatus Zymogenus saltonus]